jgi:hypothetical protein
MSQKSHQAELPSTIFRIPGAWKDKREFESRLPVGYRIDGELLVTPWGPLVLESRPADREFPHVFGIACRRPLKPADLRRIRSYTMNVILMGPAGSMRAAQWMLEAGASVIRAGGIGVFIDNSLLAHSGADWLELAENKSDPAAVFYAFVNVAKRAGEIVSHGMHVLGQRDCIVSSEDLSSLEDFLRMTCAEQPEFGDGETFSDEQGSQFCLHGEADSGLAPDRPYSNPFGRWRLERI